MRYYHFLLFLYLLSCKSETDSRTEIAEVFPDGKPSKIIEHFENDSSSVRIFYKNGIVRILYSLKGGKQTGREIRYREDGSRTMIITYKDGQRNGPEYQYHPSGQIASEAMAVNGNHDGLSKSYFENGKLSCIFSYYLGKDTGWSYYFTVNGDTSRITYRKSSKDSYLFFDGKRKRITPEEWQTIAGNEEYKLINKQ